jgi:hypothetical protein
LVAEPLPPSRTAPTSIGAAAAGCQDARSRLAAALAAADGARPEAGRDAISREWVACLDEILAIADRACRLLNATRGGEGPALWNVWERQGAD